MKSGWLSLFLAYGKTSSTTNDDNKKAGHCHSVPSHQRCQIVSEELICSPKPERGGSKYKAKCYIKNVMKHSTSRRHVWHYKSVYVPLRNCPCLPYMGSFAAKHRSNLCWVLRILTVASSLDLVTLTPSLPWCHLKTTINNTKPFCFLFCTGM